MFSKPRARAKKQEYTFAKQQYPPILPTPLHSPNPLFVFPPFQTVGCASIFTSIRSGLAPTLSFHSMPPR
jgi:hypothetical protein